MTSDHGESFSHGYYFNHRGGLWDEITHVPLIIKSNGFREGKRVTEQVGLIDLLPTILELAGLPLDSRMQGRSLVGLANGKIDDDNTVFSITDPWMPNPQFSARTNQWKWISSKHEEKVYNLSTDPSELIKSTAIPAELIESKVEYSSLITSLKSFQIDSPTPRTISDEECQRLKSLGYINCQ